MPDLVGSLKKLIESEDFCNRHKERPQDFTRNRALPFKNLIYYMINLPVAAYEHGRQGDPCPKARVSQLYDVLNHITIAASISSKNIGERELAAAHSVHLSSDDLLLLDRGYECFWLFKLILISSA